MAKRELSKQEARNLALFLAKTFVPTLYCLMDREPNVHGKLFLMECATAANNDAKRIWHEAA